MLWAQTILKIIHQFGCHFFRFRFWEGWAQLIPATKNPWFDWEEEQDYFPDEWDEAEAKAAAWQETNSAVGTGEAGDTPIAGKY